MRSYRMSWKPPTWRVITVHDCVCTVAEDEDTERTSPATETMEQRLLDFRFTANLIES